jgi:ferrous iron transport protein B
MWEKGKQYLRKMGGVILIASIIIWFLGYFPFEENKAIRQQNSYIGQLGQTIQPVFQPLGFDWKMSVSLLTGMAAKEVVVSTMSVLYTGKTEEEETPSLAHRLRQDVQADGSPVFTPLSALSLMFFVLIYFPCIATVTAIAKESKSWKWGLFVIVYTCVLAWVVSFIVYQTGSFFSAL